MRRKTNRLFRELHQGPLTELRNATATWHGAARPTEAHRAFEALRETVRTVAGQNFHHIGEALVSVIDIAEQMWNSANVWTMIAFRTMVGIGVLTPLILLGFAYIGTPEATGVIATWFLYGTFIVLPLVWLLAFFNDPWIIGVALAVPKFRAALKKLGVILLIGIAAEFLWAFFLATVPLTISTRTLTLVLLGVIPVICLALAGKKKAAKWTAVSTALVITVLAVGGWGIAFAKTKGVAKDVAGATGLLQETTYQLRADTTPDGNMFHRLSDGVAVVVVETPGGAWSEWAARPVRAPRFNQRPEGYISYQERYSDGTLGPVLTDSPFPRRKDEEEKRVTGLRFYSPVPVRIRLELQ